MTAINHKAPLPGRWRHGGQLHPATSPSSWKVPLVSVALDQRLRSCLQGQEAEKEKSSTSISYSGGEAKSAREQDHSLPRARENSHNFSHLCQQRKQHQDKRHWSRKQKRMSSLRTLVLPCSPRLWKATPFLNIPQQHFRKKALRERGFLRS